MRAFFTLLRRELSSTFASVIGYVVMAAVLWLVGLSFVLLAEALNEASDTALTESFYNTLFFWVILLLSAPLITMRAFAQERAAGTYETLMTTPVSDLEVVLAKFAGCLLFYVVLWLPLLVCIVVVRHFTDDPAALEWGAVVTTYLGIILLGAVYMAMGVFASALTHNQIIAAILGLLLGVGLFLLSFAAPAMASATGWQANLLRQFSMVDQMQDFVRGVIDFRHVVFQLSLAVVFLFLTIKVIEGRRWR